jgi:NAD(P)-dependent dehydrogenase (short-subunit alcohol dehydrogenase family)
MQNTYKSALIAGGTRGLGRALALKLSSTGTRVVIVARSQIELDRTVESIRTQGGTALGILADIADPRSIYPTAAQAAEFAGPIELLVNNASTLGAVPLRSLLESDCEDFTRVLATNLVAPFRLTKAVLGSMIVNKKGTIVNISSDAAVAAYPEWGFYSSSKAGLDHLAKVWAAELEATAIKIINIDPGEMNTLMHAQALPSVDPTTLAIPEDVASQILSSLPALDSGRYSVSELEARRS